MNKDPEIKKSLVYSYLAHRTAIGVLGMALPFVLSLGAWIFFQTGMQGSISSYYHTGMRNVLVGSLWAIGFFLLSYKGYDRDHIASIVASIGAIGISLFPVTSDTNSCSESKLTGNIHLFFAALFFITLIYFSLFLFTKTDQEKIIGKKQRRNLIYKMCGYVMAGCILLIAIYFLFLNTDDTPLKKANPVFWLETVAILSFGFSWLVKGQAILKDNVND